jgi:hypothetical protein
MVGDLAAPKALVGDGDDHCSHLPNSAPGKCRITSSMTAPVRDRAMHRRTFMRRPWSQASMRMDSNAPPHARITSWRSIVTESASTVNSIVQDGARIGAGLGSAAGMSNLEGSAVGGVNRNAYMESLESVVMMKTA